MKYIIITSGLRGCYMPDNIECLAFSTRRELKSYLIERAGREDGEGAYVGLSLRDLAWAAAHFWRGGQNSNTLIPYGFRGQGKPYCYELTRTTRKDYLERIKDDN